jgi:hypothetical protein
MARQHVRRREHAHDRQLVAVFVARQVHAGRPRFASVTRDEDAVAPQINLLRIVWRDHDRSRPVEPVRGCTSFRVRLDGLAVSGRAGEPNDVAALRFRVDRAGVGRVNLRVHPVAEIDLEPILVGDANVVARGTRAAPGVGILQAAADRIRALHVHADPVELRERNVVDLVPCDAGVERVVQAAIVPEHEMLRVRGLIQSAW